MLKLGQDALGHVLSHVISPETMATLCAACRVCAKAAWSPGAWRDSVIDTSRIKPNGFAANSHFTCWRYARLIVGGRWQLSNAILLISPLFGVWTWREVAGGSRLVCGKRVLVSQSTVPAKITLRFDVVGVEGDVLVGLASTNDPGEILAASNGNTVSWRGKPTPVDIEFSSLRLHRPGAIREVLTFALERAFASCYAAVVFDQTSPPVGTVSPCWTKR